MLIFLASYFVLTNGLSLYLMILDKKKSIIKAWRIPERTLLMLTFFGGFVGTCLAMKYVRHKTKHWQFYIVTIFSAFVWLFGLPAFYLFGVKLYV